eukprot:UN34099
MLEQIRNECEFLTNKDRDSFQPNKLLHTEMCKLTGLSETEEWKFNESEIKQHLIPKLLKNHNKKDSLEYILNNYTIEDFNIDWDFYKDLNNTYESALQGLIDAKESHKLLNTYINALPMWVVEKTGRIHASLKLNTVSGRLSCSNPNLQNQPSVKDKYEIRKAYVPT